MSLRYLVMVGSKIDRRKQTYVDAYFLWTDKPTNPSCMCKIKKTNCLSADQLAAAWQPK